MINLDHTIYHNESSLAFGGDSYAKLMRNTWTDDGNMRECARERERSGKRREAVKSHVHFKMITVFSSRYIVNMKPMSKHNELLACYTLMGKQRKKQADGAHRKRTA